MSAENDLPTLQLSVKARTGLGKALGEFIATFGLILTNTRHRSFSPRVGRARCRALHRGGLLVYLVNQLRQPRDHRRAQPDQHVRLDSTARHPLFVLAQLLGGLRGTAGEGPLQFALMSAMGRRQTFAGV